MTGPIIVGVDGSETALAAARRAAELARALAVPLHVMTAYSKDEIVVLEVGSDVFRIDTEEAALEMADKVIDLIEARDIAEPGAARGKPADMLVETAERLDASMIVVGNKRMQGVGRVLGSIANSVSHNAPCDVHIVKTT